MTPANVNTEKIEDPEKQALAAAYLPTSLRSDDTPSKDDFKSTKMSRIQKLFCALLLCLLTITIVSATPALAPRRVVVSAAERAKFKELLNTIEPSSLHDILHKHLGEKYQHGVYQEDKTAMDVVHQSNADVAHSLIELAKRQAGNETTSATSTPSTTTTTPTTTTNPPTTSDTPTTPTTSQTSAPPATTSQTTQAPSPTSSTPTTAATPTTTPPSSTPSSAASTSTKQETSTNANTTPTTTTAGRTTSSGTRSVTQQTIYTTTYADGAVATVTSITVVGAQQGEQTGVATKTNGANASLQSNGVSSNGVGLGGLLGAFGVVVAAAL